MLVGPMRLGATRCGRTEGDCVNRNRRRPIIETRAPQYGRLEVATTGPDAPRVANVVPDPARNGSRESFRQGPFPVSTHKNG